jgi:WD40 repeat protein
MIWRAASYPSELSAEPTLLDSWLKHGPPLFLVLEWDRIRNQDVIFAEVVEYLSSRKKGEKPCCLITCHSNLGESANRFRSFKLLEMQRIHQAEDDTYRQMLAFYITPGIEESRSRGIRARLGSEGLLPHLMHLVRVCSEAGEGATDSDILRTVVNGLLRETCEGKLEFERSGFTSPQSYQQALRQTLGAIALAILLLDRTDTPSPKIESAVEILRKPAPRDQHKFDSGTTKANRLALDWEHTKTAVEMWAREQIAVNKDQVFEALWKQIDAYPPFFLLKEEGWLKGSRQFRFIHEMFLAYFAGACGLRSYADRSAHGESWQSRAVQLLVERPQLNLAAPFLAGSLSEESEEQDLNRILLCALTYPIGDFGDEKVRLAGERLVKSVLGLCQGANPDFPIPKVLREGQRGCDWRSLEDPCLLRGELHALLGGEECASFRGELEEALRTKEQPWLQRWWPKVPPSQLTTDHADRVTVLLTLPGQQVVSGDAAGEVIWWDLTTGERKRLQHAHGSVRALAWFDHENVRYVVSAGDDGAVHRWVPRSGEIRRQPQAHAGEVLAVTVLHHGDSPRILSAGGEGLVYVWSAFEEGEPVASYSAHRGSVRILRTLDSLPRAVSAGDDGCVCLWWFTDGGTLDCLRLDPPNPAYPVTAVTNHASELVWGDELGRTFSFVLGEEKPVPHRDHTQPITDLLLIKGGWVYSAGEDGRVVRWRWSDRDGWRRPRSLVHQPSPVRGLALVGGKWVAYATEEGAAGWVDPSQSVRLHPGSIRFMKAILDDENEQVVTAGERLVRVGALASGIGDDPRHLGQVTSVALGEGFFVSGGSDGSVMLHEWATKPKSCKLQKDWPTHHSGPVRFLRVCGSLAQAPRLIVTAGADGKVCVWERSDKGLDLLEVWEDAPVTALWAEGDDVVWATEDGNVFWRRPHGREAQPRDRKVPHWPLGREVTALDARRSPTPEQAPDIVVALSRGEILHIGHERPLPIRCPDDVVALRWLDRGWLAVATAKHAGVYSVDGGQPQNPLCPIDSELSGLGCSPDRQWIACGTLYGRLKAVNWPTSTSLPFAQVHGTTEAAAHEVVAVQFASADVVVSASRDGTVKFSRLTTRCVEVLGGCPVGAQVTSLAVKEAEVLAGLVDGSVVVLRIHPLCESPPAR